MANSRRIADGSHQHPNTLHDEKNLFVLQRCCSPAQEAVVEVRIGITHSAREISFETEATAEELRALIEAEATGLVAIEDNRGRQFLVNRESISYVELGSENARKVGFVS